MNNYPYLPYPLIIPQPLPYNPNPQKDLYIRTYTNFKPEVDMTLIIGMKYKDGVVLIADRQITDGHDKHHWEDKISSPLNFLDSDYIKDIGFTNKIAIGGSGWTDLIKEFNRKIGNTARQQVESYKNANLANMSPVGVLAEDIKSGKINRQFTFQYKIDNFLDDSVLLVKSLNDMTKVSYGTEYNRDFIDILVAVYTDKPMLFSVLCTGFKTEKDYLSIGSGSVYIQQFLENNYKKDMDLKKCVVIGSSLIRYVEKFKLGDSGVSNESGKLPQIFIVTKEKCEEYNFEDNEAKNILEEADKRIESIKKELTF